MHFCVRCQLPTFPNSIYRVKRWQPLGGKDYCSLICIEEDLKDFIAANGEKWYIVGETMLPQDNGKTSHIISLADADHYNALMKHHS